MSPQRGREGGTKMPKKETFTSRFEETRGGRVPQKSKIWGDIVYGWSLIEIEPTAVNHLKNNKYELWNRAHCSKTVLNDQTWNRK